MSSLKSALLPKRGVIRVSGADAKKLLQGVITGDMERLDAERSAIHSGLLTPQGKILFDFFVVRHRDAFLIETDKASVPDLVKRLLMYKLRADVGIADVCEDYTVAVVCGEGVHEAIRQIDCIAFNDPRLPDMGARLLMSLANDGVLLKLGCTPKSEAEYRTMRIALGVPEAGKDFELGGTFPHEALFDQLGGVSFTKGCFVGQEVVSRMEHRGSARKRVVPLAGETALPETGSEVRAGASVIGTLGSVSGDRALALLRLDRAAEAMAKGEVLTAGTVPVSIEIPDWATFSLGGDGETKK